DRRVVSVAMPANRGAGGEGPRGDLAAALLEAACGGAEVLFGETVVGLGQDEDGVGGMLDRAGPRRLDPVVGADGLHSTVRRLAFGPERDFVRHLGLYVATMPLGEPADHPHDVLMFNTPGRLVSIHPSREQALVAFIFRSPAIAGLDH